MRVGSQTGGSGVEHTKHSICIHFSENYLTEEHDETKQSLFIGIVSGQIANRSRQFFKA